MTQPTRINSQASKVMPSSPKNRILASNRAPFPSEALLNGSFKNSQQAKKMANILSQNTLTQTVKQKDTTLISGEWVDFKTRITNGKYLGKHPT